MSFLTPWFLAGGLAVALPLIFHLVRKTAKKRREFSSLMFLQPTPPRITRRNRLEDLPLLLLRCLALCLLAAGFARPFLQRALPEPPSPTLPQRIVALVDTSASMRRANLWSTARDKLDAVLRKTSPVDRVAVLTFDRQVTPRVTFEEWDATPAGDRAALARSRIAAANPGWGATFLDRALVRATELLAEAEDGRPTGPRRIVVISDFQEGSRLAGLQSQEWPKGVEVVSERVTARPTSNASLQWLPEAAEAPRSTNANVRLRVSNEPDSKREQFRVAWAGPNGELSGTAQDIYVPAGQARIVNLPAPRAEAGADRVVLRGDDEDFDNTVYVVPPEAARLTVMYFGGEPETDPRQPLYFLRRAFQETRGQAVRVVVNPGSVPPVSGESEGTTLLIATGALPEARAQSLGNSVTRGATLLFAPTNAAAADTLGRVPGLGGLIAAEGAPAGYAMLGEIDFRHPLFLPFADARYSDFTKIHFWKYRRLDPAAVPGARVLARFDNGDAAIFEVPVGKGRVVVLASGWHPADSQLALSSKFVPLLYSVLELDRGAPTAAMQSTVGDVVALPSDWVKPSETLIITRPDGSALTLAAGEPNFTQTVMPGIYRVSRGAEAKRFAVNLDAAESRTGPMPLDALERLGAPLVQRTAEAAHQVQREVRLRSAELESRQKLWRWFVVATLAVLLIETSLAGWIGRRRLRPEGAAT